MSAKLRRRLRGGAALVLTGALIWAGGFAWFVQATGLTPPLPDRADGIVALTGGTERVETALRLLAEGRAGRLLISGVGGAAEFSALAHRAGVDAALAPRVTLGRAAVSTHGNAVETGEWARSQRIGTLIVVTAGYHMPRALAELARTLPGVRLYPAPVQPPALREGVGLSGVRLLAGEFTKFLAAEAGLSAITSRRDERSAARGPAAGPSPGAAPNPPPPNLERGG